MDSLSDSLLAQLMAMGFEQEDIVACKLALKSSGTPFSVQSMTDWLLQQQSSVSNSGHAQSDTPTLKLGTENSTKTTTSVTSNISDQSVGSLSRPLSSGAVLGTRTPIKSRHDYGEEKRRQRDEYDAKEREEAVKKARERRMNEYRAKEQIRQQIAEDRQRKAEKSQQSKVKSVPAPTQPSVGGGTTSTATPTQCRVQIRLQDGSVLRSSFPPSANLNDVCKYIQSTKPFLTGLQLVQPFPHKEFSEEEHSRTLLELGLFPSASLVVSKNCKVAGAHPPVKTTEPEPMDTSDGSNTPQPMEEEEDEADSDDGARILPHLNPSPPGGGVGHGRGMPPFPRPGGMFPPAGAFPRPGAGGGLPPPVRMPYPPMNVPNLGGGALGGSHHNRMSFGGEGRRLGGGRDDVQEFQKPKEMSSNISKNALAAAEKRAKLLKEMSEDNKAGSSGVSDLPSLEVLSLRCLARWSSVDYLPSCASLPPRVAQRLLSALVDAKQLHPKTLNAFLKCPLQVMVLDNYCYATNQLVEMLRYFSSLKHLSLVSCTLLTDKSLALLLPYLSNLVHLNLNGCHPLSDEIFYSFKDLIWRLSKL